MVVLPTTQNATSTMTSNQNLYLGNRKASVAELANKAIGLSRSPGTYTLSCTRSCAATTEDLQMMLIAGCTLLVQVYFNTNQQRQVLQPIL